MGSKMRTVTMILLQIHGEQKLREGEDPDSGEIAEEVIISLI